MRKTFLTQIILAITVAGGVMPLALYANQTAADQADPAVIEDELRDEDRASPKIKPPVVISRPQGGATSVSQTVTVGAVRIEGARILPPGAFAPVIEAYAGRTLTPEGLSALATDVANVARDSGYGLATAWIPEQRIENGVIRVVLDEGRIDAVEVEGDGGDAVRRSIAVLANGRPVRTAELERQLLIAGDLPGVRVGNARLQRENGRNILIVRSTRERIQARAYADNWGSSDVGPLRARLTVDLNGLIADDDQLTIGGVVTPLAPKEFGLVRAAYTKAIGTAGTEVTIGGYVARSEPSGVLASRDVIGRSSEFGFGVRHPLVRARSGSLWSSIDFRLRDSSQYRDDEIARDDRLALLTASGFAVRQLPSGRLRGRISLVQGVDLFDATRGGDPLASRRDASAVFTKVEAWMEYEQRLGSGFSFLAQAEGQAADRPLLSSEEMGLGGRYFGRAWDYREFSGDKGAAGSLELRYDLDDLPFGSVQLYGYADGGYVDNYRDGFGGGSLASAGGGIRLWLEQKVEAGLELGIPLTKGFDPLEDPKPRLSFTIGTRF